MFEVPWVQRRSDSRFDGGLVFDAHGNYFANELEGRDYVIGEMWKSKTSILSCCEQGDF